MYACLNGQLSMDNFDTEEKEEKHDDSVLELQGASFCCEFQANLLSIDIELMISWSH